MCAMDWDDIFKTPDEVMDEPGTRAEVIAGYVFLGVFVVVLLIDLLS